MHAVTEPRLPAAELVCRARLHKCLRAGSLGQKLPESSPLLFKLVKHLTAALPLGSIHDPALTAVWRLSCPAHESHLRLEQQASRGKPATAQIRVCVLQTSSLSQRPRKGVLVVMAIMARPAPLQQADFKLQAGE